MTPWIAAGDDIYSGYGQLSSLYRWMIITHLHTVSIHCSV